MARLGRVLKADVIKDDLVVMFFREYCDGRDAMSDCVKPQWEQTGNIVIHIYMSRKCADLLSISGEVLVYTGDKDVANEIWRISKQQDVSYKDVVRYIEESSFFKNRKFNMYVSQRHVMKDGQKINY